MSDEIFQDEFVQNQYEQVTTEGEGEGQDYSEPQSEEQPTEQTENQENQPEPEPDPEPVDHLRRITSVHGNLTHATKGRPAARTVAKPRRPQTRMPGKAIAVERPPEVKNFDEEPEEKEEKEDDSAPSRPKTSVMKPMGRGMPGMPAGGFNPAAVKLKAAAPVEKKPEPAQPAPEFLNSVKLRPVTEKPKAFGNQTTISVSQSAPIAPSGGPPKRPPPGPPPGIPGQPPSPLPKGTPPPPIPKGTPPPPIPKGAPPPVPKGGPPPVPREDGALSPKGNQNPVSPRSEEKAKACETCGSKFGILGSAKIHCKNCNKFYCKKCCKKGTNPSAGVTKANYWCNSCFNEVCPEAQK